MKTFKHALKVVMTIAGALLLAPVVKAEDISARQAPAPGYARPSVHVNRTPPQDAATGQLSPLWYTPAQIRSAYGFNLLPTSINGAGQTIAIIDAFGDFAIPRA